MPHTCQAETSPAHESIRALAYCLWEDAGCPSGQDIFFWTEAENRLLSAKAPKQAAAAPRAAKAAPKRKAAGPTSNGNGQAKRSPKAAASKAAR
ncbi:DUF2934 domain-containing protein [Prosthecobacter sp.]|uniref:DUF2934 domain-containing protein n=1 Tax=Prosthecobacter sp. TaxID=1965333 RepID=UPI0037848F09